MKNEIEAMITDITATTAEAEDYTGVDTLSLHDALPISGGCVCYDKVAFVLLSVGCFCFGVFLLFQPVPDRAGLGRCV